MKIRVFRIPASGGGGAEEEAVNSFLEAERILSIDRQFVQDGANSAWALFISYEPGEGRPPPSRRGRQVDYREVLSAEDFAVYAKLRSLRKTLAGGVGQPLYNLFNNEQLAEMVLRRVVSAQALGGIPGVGAGRVKKYGEDFLTLLRQEVPALPATPQPGPGADAAPTAATTAAAASPAPEPEPGSET